MKLALYLYGEEPSFNCKAIPTANLKEAFMKLTKRLGTALTAGSILLFAATAQAQTTTTPGALSSPGVPTEMVSPGSAANDTPATNTSNTMPATTTPNTTTIPAPAQNTSPENTTTRTRIYQPAPPDVNITNNIPAPASNTTNTTTTQPAPVIVPQQPSTTRVEVLNQTPASNSTSGTSPNIDIDMPDMPDINVVTPGNTEAADQNNQTVTRTDRVIINDEDDRDVNNNSLVYMSLFGILAVLLIAGVAYYISRRPAIDDVI